MSTTNTEAAIGREVVLTRTFKAPRELVFDVFTQAEHIKHWWGPHHFYASVVEADVRPGGARRICMKGPNNFEHWITGVHEVVERPSRMVIITTVEGERGRPLFTLRGEAMFEDLGAETRLTLKATVLSLEDPNMLPALDGMEEGWRQSLEKMADYVDSLGGQV